MLGAMSVTISKITRAGQITLPKKIRSGKTFAHAKAVLFEERGSEVVIKPLRTQDERETKSDHLSVVEYTMRDWLDSAHDDLFEIPKGI